MLVISAPSGLALGGGFEVLVQSDYVVAHSNIVTGLVETLSRINTCGRRNDKHVMEMDANSRG